MLYIQLWLAVLFAVIIAHFQMPMQLEAMRLQAESGDLGSGGSGDFGEFLDRSDSAR